MALGNFCAYLWLRPIFWSPGRSKFRKVRGWGFYYTHRIHGAGIYANIWGILMVNVTIYSMDPMGYIYIYLFSELWILKTLKQDLEYQYQSQYIPNFRCVSYIYPQ